MGIADAKFIGDEIIVVRLSRDIPQDEADAVETAVRTAVAAHRDFTVVVVRAVSRADFVSDVQL